MEYTSLGKTGIKVSVAGLGCGGTSLVGLKQDKSGRLSIGLVRQAIDLGVNFFDTAEGYGTEHVVGQVIAEVPRDRIVLSTKKTFLLSDGENPEREIRRSLEQSLKRLRTDYIDIYHVHGVDLNAYGYAKERILPVFKKFRAEGKIRALGITERFLEDPAHTMLQHSLQDNSWDVIMIGFNLLIPGARRNIFPLATRQGVGVIVMYAARSGLSQPARLKAICQKPRDVWFSTLSGLPCCSKPNASAWIILIRSRFPRSNDIFTQRRSIDRVALTHATGGNIDFELEPAPHSGYKRSH